MFKYTILPLLILSLTNTMAQAQVSDTDTEHFSLAPQVSTSQPTQQVSAPAPNTGSDIASPSPENNEDAPSAEVPTTSPSIPPVDPHDWTKMDETTLKQAIDDASGTYSPAQKKQMRRRLRLLMHAQTPVTVNTPTAPAIDTASIPVPTPTAPTPPSAPTAAPTASSAPTPPASSVSIYPAPEKRCFPRCQDAQKPIDAEPKSAKDRIWQQIRDRRQGL